MSRLIFSQILLLFEAIAIVALYQVFSDFECRQTNLFFLCRGVRLSMVLGLCLAAGFALLLFFQPGLRQGLVDRAATGSDTARRWAGVHLAGLALVAAPTLILSQGQLVDHASIFLSALALGGVIALVGAALWLMPARAWRSFFADHARILVPTIAITLLIPSLAWAISLAWNWFETLQLATFYSVAILLAILGNDVFVNLERETIGIVDFFVEVAESCSGIEGLALTTAFMAIYALMMKDDLRMGRFWLIVWPAALLLSFILNVVRITVLITIGAFVSPELAVNGFHSFAGWLSFTLLALVILTIVNLLPGLSKTPRTAQRGDAAPLTEDRSAAFIVPFLAFMFSGLVVHTFSQTPEVWYGVQVGAMALALWVFRKPVLALTRDIDLIAVGAGVLIGIGWIVTSEPAEPYASLAEFGTLALTLWVVLRVIGTSILVPVVEELFFRGYLFSLIDDGSLLRRGLAIAITTAGFAALHSRPLAAAIAGIIFALVLLRRGRLFDAILCHAVANALIAAAALATGQWSLI
ncbi:MAG: exosortase E/protease, VPEID-CTERM system [Marivita sp.]|uniref:exosortase E/protease, VPEID-CTERM system n=1 Tax=Marivita sp. TaxID=2003365 RepID=UPI0025BFD1B5|nr:exosortase E/protease, VPEID-CTERM system [Marivita sp.]MCI5112662.1 exosortase E/protease, VPEID-CTERM system [Marivita sp.]